MHRLNIAQEIIDRIMKRRGHLYVYKDLDPAHTAIVCIDMQNLFLEKGSPSEVPVAREIVPNINRLAEAARRTGGLVVWVIGTFGQGGPSDWSKTFAHFVKPEIYKSILQNIQEGSAGRELWPELDVQPDDPIVYKNRFSAFLPGASNIVEILRSRDIDTVVITGTATNVCCESSARDAMMLDFKTIMVSDGNAARSDAEHVATLSTFLEMFGDVLTTEETIDRLVKGSTKKRL